MKIEDLQAIFDTEGNDLNCTKNVKTDAAYVAYSPPGSLSATNMQDALDELAGVVELGGGSSNSNFNGGRPSDLLVSTEISVFDGGSPSDLV